MTKKKLAYSVSTLVVCTLTVLFLIYESDVSPEIQNALSVFVCRVLPPLFPFMVMSKLIVSLGLLDGFSRKLGIGGFFGLPAESGAVILTGILCGFPIGSVGTCELYGKNKIKLNEAERLAALSSNAGAAFVLGTVSALWDSRAYGVFLLIIQSVSAVATALIFKPSERSNISAHTEVRSCTKTKNTNKVGFFNELCTSVSESALSCLSVCAYIVFSRACCAIFANLLSPLECLFRTVFEFSTGCIYGASVGGKTGIFLTGFSVGFAGLSVMMQNYNILSRHGIPMKTLIISKLIQGCICGISSVLFYTVYQLYFM